jgi:hypothetical protein
VPLLAASSPWAPEAAARRKAEVAARITVLIFSFPDVGGGLQF